jgi:hypothetical protein
MLRCWCRPAIRKNSPPRRGLLGAEQARAERGLAQVRELFSWQAVAAATEALYRKAINGSPVTNAEISYAGACCSAVVRSWRASSDGHQRWVSSRG